MIPSLEVEKAPFHSNDMGNLLLRFRENGFAVIPCAFKRASVDKFLEQLRASLKTTEFPYRPYELPDESPLFIAPTRAPRIREVVRRALSPMADPPFAGLLQCAWTFANSNPNPVVDNGWHKDWDHAAVGNASANGYHYPDVVNIAMFFEDMAPDYGPTAVIPRSHRDASLSPFAGSAEQSFLCRKEDAVIWDPRIWHRSSTRKVDGLRIFTNFIFYPVQTPSPIRMPAAQRAACLASDNPEDKLMYGGPFQ